MHGSITTKLKYYYYDKLARFCTDWGESSWPLTMALTQANTVDKFSITGPNTNTNIVILLVAIITLDHLFKQSRNVPVTTATSVVTLCEMLKFGRWAKMVSLLLFTAIVTAFFSWASTDPASVLNNYINTQCHNNHTHSGLILSGPRGKRRNAVLMGYLGSPREWAWVGDMTPPAQSMEAQASLHIGVH